jgi:hypothetical protein
MRWEVPKFANLEKPMRWAVGGCRKNECFSNNPDFEPQRADRL